MTFTDSQGRKFESVVTLATVIALKKIGVNVNDPQLMTVLADDPEKLVNTLYLSCKKSADALGVSDEKFGELLDGDTLEQAVNALWEAIASFSPPPQRAALRKIWSKTQELVTAEMNIVNAQIDGMTLESLSTLSKPAGNSPESSVG